MPPARRLSETHLQSNSPCINAAANAYISGTMDLDGLPRVVGSTPDIGAFEFQTPRSFLSYVWLQSYGLPNDGSADFVDPDGDGLNNFQEWIAGTDPTNSVSTLRLLAPLTGPSSVTVTWQRVANRSYFIERATDLSADPLFKYVASNITGCLSTTSFTDNVPRANDLVIYRVGVQPP